MGAATADADGAVVVSTPPPLREVSATAPTTPPTSRTATTASRATSRPREDLRGRAAGIPARVGGPAATRRDAAAPYPAYGSGMPISVRGPAAPRRSFVVGASAGMASMATTWPAVGRSAGFSRRHASTADRTGSARPASSGPAAPAIGGRPVAANTSTPPNAKTSPASAAGAVEAAVSSGATYPGVPYPGPAARVRPNPTRRGPSSASTIVDGVRSPCAKPPACTAASPAASRSASAAVPASPSGPRSSTNCCSVEPATCTSARHGGSAAASTSTTAATNHSGAAAAARACAVNRSRNPAPAATAGCTSVSTTARPVVSVPSSVRPIGRSASNRTTWYVPSAVGWSGALTTARSANP